MLKSICCGVCRWPPVCGEYARIVLCHPPHTHDRRRDISYMLKLISEHQYLLWSTKHLLELIFTIAISFKVGVSIMFDICNLSNDKFSSISARYYVFYNRGENTD